MASAKVRADYDQLKEAANRFSGQAEATQKTLQALQRELDVLQGGDWVGSGASAFYAEMGSQVLPTFKRLANALATAQQTTQQVNQVMAQAEAEAARWLRGEGDGQPSTGEGQAALFASAVGSAGGGVGSAASGGLGGAGFAAAVPPQPQPARGAAPPTLADAVARMIAADNAAVDRRLAQFSPGVRDLVKRSPTLRAQIFALDQARWTIVAGPPGSGFSSDEENRTIRIEQPGDDADTVSIIAHEVGHAVDSSNWVPSTPRMTRDEYVQERVAFQLLGEGRAQFNAVQVRQEVIAAGGPDIGIPAGQDAAFQAVHNDFVAGRISHAQAIQRMGNLMGSETPSRVPLVPGRPIRTFTNYRDYYADYFNFNWDANIDEPPPRP